MFFVLTAKCLKSKKSYRIFHMSKKQYFSMHFGFNNQFIKVKRTLAKISKTTKLLFCLILVSGIMNLYVNRILDIKKIFSFDDFEQLVFYPIPQHDFRFYQTKQCSLPQVGCSWGANTFPLRNLSPYPISETSQGSQ